MNCDYCGAGICENASEHVVDEDSGNVYHNYCYDDMQEERQ